MHRPVAENYMVAVRAERSPKRLRRIQLFAVLIKVHDSEVSARSIVPLRRTRLPGKDPQ